MLTNRGHVTVGRFGRQIRLMAIQQSDAATVQIAHLERFRNDEVNDPSKTGLCTDAAAVRRHKFVERQVMHDVTKSEITLYRPCRKAFCGVSYDCRGGPAAQTTPVSDDALVQCRTGKFRLLLSSRLV